MGLRVFEVPILSKATSLVPRPDPSSGKVLLHDTAVCTYAAGCYVKFLGLHTIAHYSIKQKLLALKGPCCALAKFKSMLKATCIGKFCFLTSTKGKSVI